MIGPCPSCGELVVVFQNKVVPIDKDILADGSRDEKRKHLLDIISVFLDPIIDKISPESFDLLHGMEMGSELDGVENSLEDIFEDGPEEDVITPDEFEDFKNIELKMIDDYDFFRQVFGV
ncbi:hypothetical protein ACFL1X_00495 [Candidatus Hydrogenedentota bacterium]